MGLDGMPVGPGLPEGGLRGAVLLRDVETDRDEAGLFRATRKSASPELLTPRRVRSRLLRVVSVGSPATVRAAGRVCRASGAEDATW